jgi:antitoxin PrlF
MRKIMESESTLTDRYQTTVPEPVRRALKLGKRDRIQYAIRANGEVVMSRAAASKEEDPVLARFLGFLARDMAAHPDRLQALDPALAGRIRALVQDVEIDLEAPLGADEG